MSQSGAKQAFGDSSVLGGKTDPRVAPGANGKRGDIYVLARPVGQIVVLQKQDAGKTINWVEIAAPTAILWCASIEYNFNTPAAGQDIYTVKAGEVIITVKNTVLEVFDGAPSLTVGDNLGDNDRFMQAAESNLFAVNQYDATPVEEPVAGTKIQAFFTDGGATQGRGIIAVQKLIVTGAVV